MTHRCVIDHQDKWVAASLATPARCWLHLPWQLLQDVGCTMHQVILSDKRNPLQWILTSNQSIRLNSLLVGLAKQITESDIHIEIEAKGKQLLAI